MHSITSRKALENLLCKFTVVSFYKGAHFSRNYTVSDYFNAKVDLKPEVCNLHTLSSSTQQVHFVLLHFFCELSNIVLS